MWKYVTRGIRESFERRASCRTNVYSQPPQENGKSEVKSNLACNRSFLSPTLVDCTNGFCGTAKPDGAKNKQHESGWNAKHTWTEAVGWSSVLAVGWVVCQSLCLHRRLFGPDPEASWRKRISQAHDVRISHLLAQVLSLQPNHVLPITNCVGSNRGARNNESVEPQWVPNRPYGPITVEEALDEAGDEFTRTHKLVMGELELRLGVKALEAKRYKEAVKHFSTGANLSSPASMFNLALCYEMGLGTFVDFRKAAKYYQDATKYGHAGAMYNLGVFYAQGRGGVVLDMNMARKLFTDAAKLGQPEAQHALDLEKPKSWPKRVDTSETINCTLIDEAPNSNTKTRSVMTQLAGYEVQVTDNMDTKSNLQIPYPKQRRDKVKSATELFLEILGLQEPSPVLINASSSKDTVSY